MGGSWLPSWFGLIWSALLAAVLAVHLWHVVVMVGRNRLWHGVHVLVAAAMIVMYLPGDRMTVSGGWGAALFGVIAVILVGGLVGDGTLRGAAGRLWLLAVLDLVVMAYMFASTTVPTPPWLTVGLAALFVLQAAAWAGGRLCSYLATGGLGVSGIAVQDGATSSDGRRLLPVATVDRELHGTAIRATLAVMGLGMAYMLLVMQFGSGGMAGM